LADGRDTTREIRDMNDRPATVLLIEDNPGDARLIQELLAEGGGNRFKLKCATHLSAGLERLANNDIGLVLLDLGLPDSQGFDTFAKTYAQAPRVPIIVLSGLTDEQLAIKTVQEGAQDYLVKGHVDSHALVRTIRYAIERKQAQIALRRERDFAESLVDTAPAIVLVLDTKGRIIRFNPYMEEISGYRLQEVQGKDWLTTFLPRRERKRIRELFLRAVTDIPTHANVTAIVTKGNQQRDIEWYDKTLKDEHGKVIGLLAIGMDITERKQAEEELQRSYHKLRESLIVTVNTLASTVEMRDPYTAGHQRRVTLLACTIATEMDLSEEQFDGLRMAGLVHDIGKIGVPAEILNKPGSLSEIEFNIIKTHPQAGYNILKEIEFPWPVAQIVLQHHERLDGSGYPQGLKNGGIMLEARILAVADVVEAIASHRPYRPVLGIEVALEEIAKNRGILYDPDVTDICQGLFTEKGFKF
jgi:PAS domain S-box-containing protein/putative nucleotidyltransferase with HDIG domain